MSKLKYFVVFFSLLLFQCREKSSAPEHVPFVMTDTMKAACKFTKVHLEQVKDELMLYGKITADNGRIAQVYPVMSGSVIKISAELGEYVKQGQVLATVRSADVALLKREKLDAQSDLALAEKNMQVNKELYEGKLASEKEWVATQKEYEKAKAEVARIEEVYHIYHLSGGTEYEITSPIDGFIVFKDINQNELLRSDKSDAIFSIAQIDEVWAVANVNETDISKVKLGCEATVQTIAYPEKLFTGKVDKVMSAIDPETKAMKAIIKIRNTDLLLKPEMNATIQLSYLEDRKLVAVPTSAVIFDKSRYWVMVYNGPTHVETRQVKIYSQPGNVTYLLWGVEDGETIISANALLIYDALND